MSVAATSPLRIALAIHSLQGGGAERLMSQLANRWAEANHEVHLVTLASVDSDDRASLPPDPRVRRHGLGLMKQSRSPLDGVLANWKRVREVKRVLKSINPDFILSFCDRMNIVVSTSAQSFGVPVWLSEHSDPRRQNLGKIWELWRSFAYRRATGCIVLTPAIRQWMCQRFPGLPVEVIPASIDPPKDDINQAAGFRSELIGEESTSPKKLLAIGRLSPEKNHCALIHAWHTVANRFPEWRLVLAGDGPERANLVQLSHGLELESRIEFLGWVSDPWKTIRSADLVVLPSLYEGFPVVLLEAMSAGRACVSTPSCDTAIEFERQNSIELANSFQPKDIATALEKLMKDPARCAELGGNGQRIADEYNWTRIGPLWDKLLSSSGGAGLRAERQ